MRSPPVSSGNTLKHVVSTPSAEHSATVPRGACSGQEGLVSPEGTGSPTQAGVSVCENGHECIDGVSAPRGVIAHPLGAIPLAGDGAGVCSGGWFRDNCVRDGRTDDGKIVISRALLT